MSTELRAPYDENYYYSKLHARSRRSTTRAGLLRKLFPETTRASRLLDFGCNDGSFVSLIAGSRVRCVGVDVNQSALELARRFGRGRFATPDEVTERFACVTAFDVIEHFEDLHQFFELMDKYLEPSGRLILTTPNKNSKWATIFGFGWHGFGIPQFHRLLLSRAALASALERHGYAVERMFTVPPIERFSSRLLILSGCKRGRTKIGKILFLPLVLAKLAYGKLSGGEEDTICVVARKIGPSAQAAARRA